MATNTMAPNPPERINPVGQLVHYLRKTVTFADSGISTGISFANELPAGSSIMFALVKIKTAFNAATTNVLTVGQNSTSYNDIVNSTDIDETVTGAAMILRGCTLALASAALPYVKYTQSGTAATAGVAEVTIAYTVNNDQ